MSAKTSAMQKPLDPLYHWFENKLQNTWGGGGVGTRPRHKAQRGGGVVPPPGPKKTVHYDKLQ